jgi:hypothetical protein
MSRDICAVPGCGRFVRCLGLCHAHHMQFLKHGKITHIHIRERGGPPVHCTVCGKVAKYRKKQLCDYHYHRQLKRKPCTVIENGVPCGEPIVGRGLCNTHYLRWWRYGDVTVNKGWGPEYHEKRKLLTVSDM